MVKFCCVHQIPFMISCCLCEEILAEEQHSTRHDERREEYHDAQSQEAEIGNA